MSAPRVELLYFTGCPQVDAARQALRAALEAEGLAPAWQEWNGDDARTPADRRGYGSPTVLVDGRDVATAPAAGDRCCRIYREGAALRGAPGAATIRAALRASATARDG